MNETGQSTVNLNSESGVAEPDTRLNLLIPLVISALAFVYFEYVSVTQYLSHRFYIADIGVFNSAISGTLRGVFFESPISGWNFFAVHSHYIFFLFLPFYLLSDHVLTFATVLNIGIVAAAIPLYLFAHVRTHDTRLAAAFAVAYLFNHFVLSMHLALHPESLLMLGFFTMFFAAYRRIGWLYWLGVVLSMSIKEDVAVFVALYGIYLAFVAKERRKRLGLMTVAVAFGWLLFSLAVMQLLKPPGEIYKGGTPYIERYASFGSSWRSIFFNVLTHPVQVAKRILTRPAFYMLFAWLGFLPLFHPRSLWLILPPALIMFVSDFEAMYRLLYYYSYPFVPFLFLSSVEGVAAVTAKWRKSRPVFVALLIVVSAISYLSPTRTDTFKHRPFKVTEHHRLGRRLIREHIPPDPAVAAQYQIYCQVPNRKVLLPLWPENLHNIEYAIIDRKQIPLDLTPLQQTEVLETLTNPPFETVIKQDGYVVFHRKP